jgi:DsbC/DsbD-like thiol-disulfide interchange protein
VFAFVFVMTFGGCRSSNSDYGPGHAKVSLFSEKRTVTRGSNILLGIRFDLEPGWHLYWNGQNDTGYPPQVMLDVSEGFRTGEILWPVPRRLVSPGNILDHVYDGHVTLLLPLTVPAEAKPGRYQIKGQASWLACHEACVPGKQAIQVSFNVAGDALTAQLNKEVEDARASLPLAWEEAARVQHIESSWQDSTLVIRRPGASRMLFFPDTRSVPITDLIHAGDVQGDEMALRPKATAGRVSGILGIATPPDTIYCSFKQTLPQEPQETR